MECKKLYGLFSVQMNLLSVISTGTLYSFPCCFSLYIPFSTVFLMVSCFYIHILLPAVQEMTHLNDLMQGLPSKKIKFVKLSLKYYLFNPVSCTAYEKCWALLNFAVSPHRNRYSGQHLNTKSRL